MPHALLSHSNSRNGQDVYPVALSWQALAIKPSYLPTFCPLPELSTKTYAPAHLLCCTASLLTIPVTTHLTNSIPSQPPLHSHQSGHCPLHRREDPDAKMVAARNTWLMEVMTRLQSALGTSKLGYTGLDYAYSLEQIDAQAHATLGGRLCLPGSFLPRGHWKPPHRAPARFCKERSWNGEVTDGPMGRARRH